MVTGLTQHRSSARSQSESGSRGSVEMTLQRLNSIRRTINARQEYMDIAEVGRGTFGVVHLCVRKEDNRSCVLKKVPMNQIKTDKQKEQARQEAKILEQLKCPYIVEYIDSFLEEDVLYIALEYCQGGDLKRWLGTGPLLEDRHVWRIILRINLGIAYLHSVRIIHRDIKSSNVFVTRDEFVRIGDLGTSKFLDDSMDARTFCGTPWYLSPEEVLAAGCDSYDLKVDMWALGIILYELCSDGHKSPFEDLASRLQQLLAKIVSEDPPPVKWVEFQPLLDLLLVKEPELRPSSGQLMELPLVLEAAQRYGVELSTRSQSRRVSLGPDILSAGLPDPSSSASLARIGTLRATQKSGFAHMLSTHEEEKGCCGRLCSLLSRRPARSSAPSSHHGPGRPTTGTSPSAWSDPAAKDPLDSSLGSGRQPPSQW